MRPDLPTPLLAGPRAARDRRTVGWLAGALWTAGPLVGLTVAPVDAVQGRAQWLMYLHVPTAWTAYLCFLTVLVASLGYLGWADPRWQRAGRAAAEVGLAMTLATTLVGMAWGRATWGVWWAWDPRLVSTVLLGLVYAAYLAVGQGTRGGRRAAWLGIAGFVMVPLVHFSVVWFRSLHQRATVLAPDSSPPIDALILAALLLCVAACAATAAWLALVRMAALERRAGVSGAARTASAAR
ncbi:cytochrome c biogenesis protein CcsA [Phytohabitans kaempferiae]|uniref:Heme exporter protein C n=1 Tax=Phytohabitans kaempferiae TaxID=1620943 RepID=A0ABV6MAT8_9ACTN